MNFKYFHETRIQNSPLKPEHLNALNSGLFCCLVLKNEQNVGREYESLPDMLFIEHWLFFLFLFGTSGHLWEEKDQHD